MPMDSDAVNASEQDTVHHAPDEAMPNVSFLLRSVLLSRSSLAHSYGSFAEYVLYPRLTSRFLGGRL